MNYCCFCLSWLLQYWWLLYWIGISFLFLPQGAGFWIQFVTSFRSFISNSGVDRTGGCECCEEAFIDMLKILTTVDRWESCEERLYIGLRFEVFMEMKIFTTVLLLMMHCRIYCCCEDGGIRFSQNFGNAYQIILCCGLKDHGNVSSVLC